MGISKIWDILLVESSFLYGFKRTKERSGNSPSSFLIDWTRELIQLQPYKTDDSASSSPYVFQMLLEKHVFSYLLKYVLWQLSTYQLRGPFVVLPIFQPNFLYYLAFNNDSSDCVFTQLKLSTNIKNNGPNQVIVSKLFNKNW